MARIVEEYMVVKVSKLVRNEDTPAAALIAAEVRATLEEVLSATIAELTGDATLLVEVEEA